MEAVGNNSSHYNLAWGYGSAAISVVLFGSSYVPVKKYEVGDDISSDAFTDRILDQLFEIDADIKKETGMVFQFIVCNMFMIIGVVVNFIQNSPTFQSFVLIGGAMTATANVFLPLIIRMIGLGIATFIFGMFSMLPGWAVGRFGLLGVKQEIPASPVLNYIGIGLCAISGFLYMFVKSNPRHPTARYSAFIVSESGDSYMALSEHDGLQIESSNSNVTESNIESFHLSRSQMRILGCLLAALAGTVSGGAYVPVLYVMNSVDNASQNALDYVFPHFSGAFVLSTFYFIIYCVGKRNFPTVHPRSILPGYFCGFLFGIAFVASLITNAALNPSISFPIITAGPPAITLLWSLFFNEIQGKRNILLLSIAIAITSAGIALVSMSKVLDIV